MRGNWERIFSFLFLFSIFFLYINIVNFLYWALLETTGSIVWWTWSIAELGETFIAGDTLGSWLNNSPSRCSCPILKANFGISNFWFQIDVLSTHIGIVFEVVITGINSSQSQWEFSSPETDLSRWASSLKDQRFVIVTSSPDHIKTKRNLRWWAWLCSRQCLVGTCKIAGWGWFSPSSTRGRNEAHFCSILDLSDTVCARHVLHLSFLAISRVRGPIGRQLGMAERLRLVNDAQTSYETVLFTKKVKN